MNRFFRRRLLSTVAGTVPEHQCYIFLHAPHPPSQFPAKMTTPVQRELQLRLSNLGGIVNFSWPPPRSTHNARGRNEEVYSATTFSASGQVLDIPEVSLENIDEVEERIRRHVVREGVGRVKDLDVEDVHLYVCTHGARDCRCGDIGGRVVKALREELLRRNANVDEQARVLVRIGETAHVGGHKYAANLLVFPHGDWFGNMRPEHVPEVLDAVFDAGRMSRSLVENSVTLRTHWRGRMGLNKDEQRQFHTLWSS